MEGIQPKVDAAGNFASLKLRGTYGPDTLPLMMTWEQRIEFEILDCALNKAPPAVGYVTTVPVFVGRLRELLPGLLVDELRQACKLFAKTWEARECRAGRYPAL